MDEPRIEWMTLGPGGWPGLFVPAPRPYVKGNVIELGGLRSGCSDHEIQLLAEVLLRRDVERLLQFIKQRDLRIRRKVSRYPHSLFPRFGRPRKTRDPAKEFLNTLAGVLAKSKIPSASTIKQSNRSAESIATVARMHGLKPSVSKIAAVLRTMIPKPTTTPHSLAVAIVMTMDKRSRHTLRRKR